MNEFFLAFFIFVTIFIDTLAISLKAVPAIKRLAMVYVVAQSLTYITRFSLFFILPILGLILDGFLEFNIKMFLYFFAFFLMIHSIIFFIKFNVVVKNAKSLVFLFGKNLYLFYIYF